MRHRKKVGQKYTGRNGIKNNYLKLESMPSEARLKKIENKLFAVINTVKNIFPVSQKFSLCYNKIPCVFPVWKK